MVVLVQAHKRTGSVGSAAVGIALRSALRQKSAMRYFFIGTALKKKHKYVLLTPVQTRHVASLPLLTPVQTRHVASLPLAESLTSVMKNTKK